MSSTVRGITILGSTGSIGLSTLDVVARHPERFEVIALTANSQVERLFEQCQSYRPKYAVMANPDAAEQLQSKLDASGSETEVLSGVEGLERVASLDEVDDVMAAIVGAAGLRPSIAAARAGKRILLANKEALVMAGDLFMAEVKAHDAVLLPIDSEHNAIFQCMPKNYATGLSEVGVAHILLTASGGPFIDRDIATLESVTPEEAVAHPNWSMGRKISVDSATMMNKGLEVIEACWLFGASAEQIQVVIHPQSVIHSMVQYIDGSVLAQLGNPDMRTPIAHALGYPQRIKSGVDHLNIFDIARFDFKEPDMQRFPCLRLAYEALTAGGTAPAILNAANELAVEAFLQGRLGFMEISTIVEKSLEQLAVSPVTDLGALLRVDAEARDVAKELIERRTK
ncbi:MAG TPA: 1-deoxy-D-xylulose-5-phosphate reductoisomerase [Ectothiorhodospiraceae bacterium]|nr:1-deoxy-D-xylulose-5-phosphate reductoisomerase [Ectothiorhodospiraceae bacterium]